MVVSIGEAANHSQYINDYRFDPFNTFSHPLDRTPNSLFVEFSVGAYVGYRSDSSHRTIFAPASPFGTLLLYS